MTIDQPDPPLASLGLLRRLTDRHVVDQLLGAETMTRAELAATTGISKPTVSQSVRRLERDGLVAEVGPARSGRRGPAGVSYALRHDLGVAVAAAVGPDGLVVEVLDVRGSVVRRVERPVASPIAAADLTPQLLVVLDEASTGLPGPVRACALSVAGPVDRASGRLVHLPHSPFLVDELDARALLTDRVGVETSVDNDVNWAALAEHHAGVAAAMDEFCYLHLGFGIGGAVVRHGQVLRGHDGLAGEPAHMITVGPDGRATRLVECFGVLGLLRTGSDTIDVDRVAAVLEGTSEANRRCCEAVVTAVGGVVASMAALLNPAAVVVGGPWAGAGGFMEALVSHSAAAVVPPTPVLPATLGPAAPLLGARLAAVRTLQADLLDLPDDGAAAGSDH